MTRTLSPPNLLIHEFVAGGGWREGHPPSGLLGEGLAMLQAVLADFRAWGEVRTLTTRDTRLPGCELSADRVVPIAPETYDATLDGLIDECDACLLIAPESSGTLARLTDRAAAAGVHLLGSDARSVSIASDKWACYQRFAGAGLPTPATRRVTPATAGSAADTLGYPLIAKPTHGEGCSGVMLAVDERSLSHILKDADYTHGHFLLQRYVPGTPASVSMLVTARHALPLSLNLQRIRVDRHLTYVGGVVPLEHPGQEQAFEAARHAVSLFPGLRGYVGIDLVLTDHDVYLIEVNPRLTTSYVGLRRVISINLAQAIWNAALHDQLPSRVIISGRAAFSKEDAWVT